MSQSRLMVTDARPLGELRRGQYFKSNRRWYLADSIASQVRPGVWRLDVFNSAKGTRCAGFNIYERSVEVALPGAVPPPFRPATLRRRAKQAEAAAAQLRDDAETLRLLADRQEEGDTRVHGTYSDAGVFR